MKKKKKLIIHILITAMMIVLIPERSNALVSVSARSAILMEQSSGRVLFQKDAHKQSRIASITKIMTAILAIESGKMEETVKINEQVVRVEGSSANLIPGEKIKLEDLVYGLMLRSGNDAAIAIANHVGGSLEGFVFLMNQKAEEIGMTNTHFANPHGLDDHENHFSTAYDMALLTRYAMKNDKYKEISSTKVHRTPHPTENWDRKWANKNRLLDMYDYCTGGKTGFTKRAKRTLVTTATKGKMDLIAVTLNAADDWNDHIQMYETGYQTFDFEEVLQKGVVKEIKDKFYYKKVYVKYNFYYPVSSKEKHLFQIEFKMMKPKEDWLEGKVVPDIVGKAVVYFNEQPIKSIPIYYKQVSSKEKKSFFELFRSIFTSIIGVKTDG